MKFALIYILFLFRPVFSTLIHEQVLHLLKDAIQSIVTSSTIYNIIIAMNDNVEYEISLPVTNLVSQTIGNLHTVLIIKFQNGQHVESLLKRIPVSHPLIIYICTGRNILHNETQSKVLGDVWRIVRRSYAPKILLITGWSEFRLNTQNSSSNFVPILKNFWEDKILDVTILDMTDFDIILHHFNPFRNTYTKISYGNYTAEIFPDKQRNLYGYPFKIRHTYFPPYIEIEKQGDKFTIKGSIADYLSIFTFIVNGSLEIITNDFKTRHRPIPTWNEKQKWDLLPHPLTPNQHNTGVLYTTVIGYEKMCLCAPLVTGKTRVCVWKFVSTIAAGFLIMAVFKIFLTMLQVDQNLAGIINIFSLIVGMSVQRIPTTLTGRMVFISLVIVTTRYSFIFYTELFNVGINVNQDLRIVDFRSLEQSGLHLFIQRDMYMLHFSDNYLPFSLKRKTIIIENTDFLEYMKKSESYYKQGTFLSIYTCNNISERASDIHKDTVVKPWNFCPVEIPIILGLSAMMPYKDRLDDSFLRVQQSGLNNYYGFGYFKNKHQYGRRKTKQREMQIHGINSSAAQRILKYLFSGYLLAVICFLGEVLVDCVRNRRLEIKKRRAKHTAIIENNCTVLPVIQN